MKDDQIHVRLSTPRKEKIKTRAESLDRSMSEHLLICYELEESIAKGDSVVIPKHQQVSSEGVSATDQN